MPFSHGCPLAFSGSVTWPETTAEHDGLCVRRSILAELGRASRRELAVVFVKLLGEQTRPVSALPWSPFVIQLRIGSALVRFF